jgi:hypothetical protein
MPLIDADVALQEHYVQINSNWTRDIWAGVAQTETEKQWPFIKAKFPQEADTITYEQYKHYASLVRTVCDKLDLILCCG